MSDQQPKVFSLQVTGIKCTACAGKIKKALQEELPESQAKISVNIMQEKVSITVFKDQTVYEAVQILNKIHFTVIGEPVSISGGDDTQRNIAFLVNRNPETIQLAKTLQSTLGVIKGKCQEIGSKFRLSVTYNCEIVRGRELGDLVGQADPEYEVINDRINSFSSATAQQSGKANVSLTIALSLYLLLANMIIPVLPNHEEWYAPIYTFPSSWGIFSVSVILNFILTIGVWVFYSAAIVKRAFYVYVNERATNMQTLISLGTLSASALFGFFIVRYSLQQNQGKITDYYMAIMDINEALTSASIIVLVVTVGKHFQDRVKQKITELTQQIFPESSLFKNMKVNFVEIKNRKLMFLREAVYDVSLIEKNDILKVEAPCRMLVDGIVIRGEVSAIQSARTGCDEMISLTKGQRLQSGAIVKQAKECLIVVENVLEKSLLIEIGTQIKLAQNQEDSKQSGIQAVCRTISSVFVKVVILLSLVTVIIWTVLLVLNKVTVPICDACWIVERGIGVLVASCPCALGLAVPSVIAIILNLATKSGILIKNNSVFEKMKQANKIAFDKTGTLFTRLNKIEFFRILSQDYKPEKMWEMVAVVQKQLRHPLAQILYKQAFSRSEVVGTNYSFLLLQKPEVQKEGISAKLLDKEAGGEGRPLDVLIGNRYIMQNYNIRVPEVEPGEASTLLYLSANDQVLMAIALNTHSNLRPQAKDVVSKLQKQGIEVHILSGDSAQSVGKLADYLQISPHCLHPQHSAFMKMKWIKENQQRGDNVIMIGDGLNDIPCLQEAAIGISINAKSQLNINAADAVVLSQNLHKVVALVRFLRRGNLFVKLNLFWAFAYNVAAMPIVAGALYSWDIFISPVWSSVAMSASSLFVVGFSHLLSLFHYDDSLLPGEERRLSHHSINYVQDHNASLSSMRDLLKNSYKGEEHP